MVCNWARDLGRVCSGRKMVTQFTEREKAGSAASCTRCSEDNVSFLAASWSWGACKA